MSQTHKLAPLSLRQGGYRTTYRGYPLSVTSRHSSSLGPSRRWIGDAYTPLYGARVGGAKGRTRRVVLRMLCAAVDDHLGDSLETDVRQLVDSLEVPLMGGTELTWYECPWCAGHSADNGDAGEHDNDCPLVIVCRRLGVDPPVIDRPFRLERVRGESP